MGDLQDTEPGRLINSGALPLRQIVSCSIPAMRRPIIGLLGLLATAPIAHAIEPLKVEDGKLLDARGRQLVLHGINVVYKVAPYHPNEEHGETSSFNETDVRRLKRWGFNAIRLGVQWAGLEPERGEVNTAYFREIRKLVRLAARHGIYSQVDNHQDGWGEKYGGNGAPEWATYDDGEPWVPGLGHPAEYGNPAVGRAFTSFWQDREQIQTRYIASFAALARTLRKEPGVLGYDTFNEPSCEYTRDPCAFPPPPHAAGELLHPFYTRIIPALQHAHAGANVFYEDWITASSGEYSVGEPPNPPLEHTRRLGLSYHVYCASDDCEQGDRETIQRADRNARANHAFPLLTEFGATEDLETIERVARLADEAGHSWMYWTYKTYFDPYPIFLMPPATARATDQDDTWSLVSEEGEVKEPKVLTLARPYPQKIAGTDPEWEFDPDARRFEFTYRPRSRRRTVVQTNARLQYPDGYRATVKGARVVSRAEARKLRLKPRRGATRVALTLEPR